MKEKRLITAALPYINNIPHLGHIVGSHLPADIFARFCRLKGYDTLFVGGTDEHGSASEIVAEQIGVDIEKFSKTIHEEHKKIYEWIGISYDNFSRTRRKIHYDTVTDFFNVVNKNGFIKEGKMKVFYSKEDDRFLADRYVVGECPKCGYEDATDQCEKCTTILDPSQLKNPRSTITGGNAELVEAKHLFLSLDKLSPKLKKWLNSKKKTWRKQVTNLALGWIDEGLRERSITRDLKNGVPVPLKGYENKVFYVWFDAPIGYVSSTKEATKKWKEFWKGKVYNFLGKDNIPFHTIFWPGMLIAHDEFNLPEKVIGLQYLNYEGGKFSKSKKRGVFCENLEKAGWDSDIWRSYLTQIIPESSDSEFKWEEFQERINSDLVGNLGNFVNRSLSFVENKLGGEIIKPSEKDLGKNEKVLIKSVNAQLKKINHYLENQELRNAYREILALSGEGNKYINDAAPWELVKENPDQAKKVLYVASSVIQTLAVVVEPFLPNTSKNILGQLNLKESIKWKDDFEFGLKNKHQIGKVERLFSKIEDSDLKSVKEIVSQPTEVEKLFK